MDFVYKIVTKKSINKASEAASEKIVQANESISKTGKELGDTVYQITREAIEQADNAAKQRIEQAVNAAEQMIQQANNAAEQRIQQANNAAEQRILQADNAAEQTIDQFANVTNTCINNAFLMMLCILIAGFVYLSLTSMGYAISFLYPGFALTSIIVFYGKEYLGWQKTVFMLIAFSGVFIYVLHNNWSDVYSPLPQPGSNLICSSKCEQCWNNCVSACNNVNGSVEN